MGFVFSSFLTHFTSNREQAKKGLGGMLAAAGGMLAAMSEMPYETKLAAANALMGEHSRAVGMPPKIYKGSKTDPNGGHGTGDTAMMARYGHNGVSVLGGGKA